MPGGACLYGCRALAAGVEWQKAGRPGAGGCGAAMRSAPYGLWFHGDVDKAAEWAGAHSNMTHRHPMADASAAAVAAGVAEAIQGLDYHRVARMMIRAARPRDLGTAKMLRYAMRASAPIPADLATARDDLVYDRLRGWSGDEAVAGGLYAFLRHPQSYQDAILLAVNTPGDSDSLGAITGALSGAWLGFELIPARWRARVEGREWLETLSSRFVESMERAGVLEEPSDASNCLTPWRKAEA
jgi:ADP-ribosylglycohydrolase